MQVYRKDLYAAKGLKPADTYDEFVDQRQGAQRSRQPACAALALRGFAGAGQNMYIYPSIFRGFGGDWINGGKIVVNSQEAVEALAWYVDTLTKYAPPAVRNWNWPDIADAFSQGTLGVLHRRAFLGGGDHQSREVQGDRQDRLRALAEGPDAASA